MTTQEEPLQAGLLAFLNTRLDEDEAAADDIHAAECWSCSPDRFAGDSSCTCAAPARVLREVEAKRAIIREHEIRDGRCRVCTAIHEGRATRFRAPCWTLLFIADIYSDHPDYREEWAPWLIIIEPGRANRPSQ